MAHLDESTILEHAAGALAGDRAAAAEQHLDGCDECRALLAAVVQSEDGRGRDLEATLPSPRADKSGPHTPPGVESGWVGRYRLLERIGAGGMGVVYAAHDPELDRKVALKLIRGDRLAEAHVDEVRARLMREAQAMAKLSHPNVIGVFDVGTFGDEVFVAMELVEGQTLREWTRAQPRPWREVVDVFLKAGHGLAAAHAAGIVHRDFKPDNVLVGHDGRVRVTDFGLARPAAPTSELKVAAPELTPNTPLRTPLTETGALIGTPAYMAPEQHAGGAAGPRSDQFSFCVALYEALYGARPFDAADLASLAREVAAGRVRPPPRRSAVPRRLFEILAQGLAAMPARRWPSMNALLQSIGEVREPVRPGGAVGAAAVFVAVVAVAALAGTGLWWLTSRDPCRAERAAAADFWTAQGRDAVHRAFAATGLPYAEAAFAGASARLEAWLAALRDARQSACVATRVRREQGEELLAREDACLAGEVDRARALVDLFRKADAQVVEHAVEAADGLGRPAACLDRAALLGRAPEPTDPAARAKLAQARAAIAQARALRAGGKDGDALARARAASEAARASGYQPVFAEAEEAVAENAESMGKAREAEDHFYAAAAAAEAGGDDRVKAWALVGLVDVEGTTLRDAPRAEQVAQLARAALRRLGGDDVLEASLDVNLAAAKSAAGDRPAAVELARRGLDRLAAAKSATPLKVCWARAQLAMTLGWGSEAEAQLRQALAGEEAALGPDHPRVGATARALGMILLQNGDAAGALAELQRALRIARRTGKGDVSEETETLMLLGDAATAAGHYDVAGRSYDDALRLLGPDAGHAAAWVREHRADMVRRSGHPADALPELQKTTAELETLVKPGDPLLAGPLTLLGEDELDLGRLADARAHLERANRLAAGDSSPGELAETRFALARALAAGHADPARATALAREARRLLAGSKKPLAREVDAFLAGRKN